MEISDEIVEMAHKAVTTEMCEGDDMRALLRAVLTAAAPALTRAAVEVERESCAKVAETEKTMFFYPPEKEANRRKTVHGERIAAAIRARKAERAKVLDEAAMEQDELRKRLVEMEQSYVQVRNGNTALRDDNAAQRALLVRAGEAIEPFEREAGNYDRQRSDAILIEMPIHLRVIRRLAALAADLRKAG